MINAAHTEAHTASTHYGTPQDMQEKALKWAYIGSLMMYHTEHDSGLVSSGSFQSRLREYVKVLANYGSPTEQPSVQTVAEWYEAYAWAHLGHFPEEHDNAAGWLIIDASSVFMKAHREDLLNR